jgi:hypothetical protein
MLLLQGLHLKEYTVQGPSCDPVATPSNYCEAWPLLPLDDITVNGVLTPLVLDSLARSQQSLSCSLSPPKAAAQPWTNLQPH